MKYTGPKTRLSRKLGIALTPKASRVMSRKPYPPGAAGPSARGRRFRMSDYKRQLLEKQKLRAQYNLSERQLGNLYRRASQHPGTTTEVLVQLLETRLDSVVMRGGLAPTIYAARQFVAHRHILVNGQRVNLPSYQVAPGDVVSVRPESRHIPGMLEAARSASPPPYLELSPDELSVRLLRLPSLGEVPLLCELPLVVEFYSRR